MNMKIALLGILAFTGNVASAGEVRAIRPGIRGDRPAGSVLPDVSSKEKLPEGNAGAKSDEEHRIVPEDGALDEDDENEIGSDVEAPGHPGIYNALYAASDVDLLESEDGSRDEDSASAEEVASQKFDASFPGLCEDSEGRGYPQLLFPGEELSPDQCKARCNQIPDVKVQGVGVGTRGKCMCFLDRTSFIGCGKFVPRSGVLGNSEPEGTGPVNDGTGDSNPGWECFADSSLPPPTKPPTPLVNADFPGGCLDSNRWEYPGLSFKDLSPDECKAKCNDIPCQKVQGVVVGKVYSSERGNCYCSLDHKYFRGCWEFDKESLGYSFCNRDFGGTGSVKHGTGKWNPNYDCVADRPSSDAKFNTPFPGWCLDSEGRGYPNLVFKDLSPDQCKATCNEIRGVKVQGVAVGKLHPAAGFTCVCFMDRKDFRGCQELGLIQRPQCNDKNMPGYAAGQNGPFEGTGPVEDGTGFSDFTCYADSSDASSSPSSLDDVELAHQVE